MYNQLRNRHLFFSDITLLVGAVYLSFVLRLDRLDLTTFWPAFWVLTVCVIILTPVVLRLTTIYARYWRYASIEDMLVLVGAITLAVLLASTAGIAYVTLSGMVTPIPRSVPFILLLLALVVTAGPRLLVRMQTFFTHSGSAPSTVSGVLIVGAGDAGAMMAREIQRNPHLGFDLLGFVDDNSSKQGVRILGVPVLGTRQEIPQLAQKLGVKQVFIAIPTASGKTIRDIVSICDKANVQTKVVPGMYELLGGQVSVNQLRDVQIEDLLRREPVNTDIESVRQLITGRCVLVTGGGGSIGSELCRQIMRCNPARLVVLGHGENSVFGIQNELRTLFPQADVKSVIADVRFAQRIQAIFQQYRPEVVFHAAAHKHVPLMELNPSEAITNNVLGTRNVLQAALAAGVERFVMISTDKAVNPTSVMGVTKRTAELLVHQAAIASGRPYVAVRFGNVLGSRGSVVHTFRGQIAAGGPVTVTHPDMTRFFMTIPEAVQLVLQASVLGKGGEVFVLDMGEPVKIVDLARDLIELSGLEVGSDIDIVFTGLRPGEKLYEELFIPGERYQRTGHLKIFLAPNAGQLVPGNLPAMINELAEAAEADDSERIMRGLQRIVPEYDPQTAAPTQKPARPFMEAPRTATVALSTN